MAFFSVFSAKKVGILNLFWPAACRRRFFFAQIAFLQEKDNFPRLAACRRRFFLAKNDGFCGKMTFLRFIRDVNNPIGSLSSIFCFYQAIPKEKSGSITFFKKSSKKTFFQKCVFSINRIFRLGIFMISKKHKKKIAVDPTTSLFQFFLLFYCIILIGADLTTKYFIGKNRLFSNFCPF